MIDNIERNHKLGLVFEFTVGKGKLLVCMADLESATSYPEGRAFYRSVLEYMVSDDFAPKTHITLEDFQKAVIGLDSHKAAVIMTAAIRAADFINRLCILFPSFL